MAPRLKRFKTVIECLDDHYLGSYCRFISCISMTDALDYILRDPSGYGDLNEAVSIKVSFAKEGMGHSITQ